MRTVKVNTISKVCAVAILLVTAFAIFRTQPGLPFDDSLPVCRDKCYEHDMRFELRFAF